MRLSQTFLQINLELRLHLEGGFKKTEKKVTWLAKEIIDMVPVDFGQL